jgi:hypothetical protein
MISGIRLKEKDYVSPPSVFRNRTRHFKSVLARHSIFFPRESRVSESFHQKIKVLMRPVVEENSEDRGVEDSEDSDIKDNESNHED